MKKGIDYFPLDVDFFEDEKVQFIGAKFGAKGEVCAIRLLTRIYRNGYFLAWDEDAAYLFAKVVGKEFSYCLVRDIVHELVRRGFFDETILNSFRILTSRGIQERYFKACERRKVVEVDERYLLVNPGDFKNLKVRRAYSSAPSSSKCQHDESILGENVYISPKNADILQQSKVKERKVKNKQQLYINLNMEEAIKVYQDNIHPITSSIEKEKLIDLIETHGTEHVQQAIEEAVMHNARNLKYVAAVLEAWQEKGYQLASKQNPKSITSDDSEKSQSYIEFMERRKAHKAAQKGGQMGHADRRSDELHQGSARGDIRDTNTADGPREIKKILEDI